MDEQFLALLERERQAAGKVERVEMHYTGSAANSLIDNWPGGLAVFAVKTSMSVARLDVATMDRQRVEMLRAVYWDMNQIASNVETLEHTRMVAVEQEDGSFVEQEITEYERILYQLITTRTAQQRAALYAFSTAAEQERFIVDNGLILVSDELAPDDLIFWSYESKWVFWIFCMSGSMPVTTKLLTLTPVVCRWYTGMCSMPSFK